LVARACDFNTVCRTGVAEIDDLSLFDLGHY
jgi:hypothetical protein